jgi:hypothetical protein
MQVEVDRGRAGQPLHLHLHLDAFQIVVNFTTDDECSNNQALLLHYYANYCTVMIIYTLRWMTVPPLESLNLLNHPKCWQESAS